MTALVIKTDSPVVAGPLQGHWTLADWEALPNDGNRYEIIDGVLYMTTAPHSFHQWIIRRLERFIGIPAEDAGLAYCFPAPVGVIMPGCDVVADATDQIAFACLPDITFRVADLFARAPDTTL